MMRSSDEKMISLYGTTVVLYQFAPEYIEEERFLRRAEREREGARRVATAAIGLTRTSASGTNGLQQ